MAGILGLVAGAILLGCTTTMLKIRSVAKSRDSLRRAARVARVIDLVVLSGTSLGLCLLLLMLAPRPLGDRMLGPYTATLGVRGVFVLILGCIYLETRILTETVKSHAKSLPSFADRSPARPPLWDPDLDV